MNFTLSGEAENKIEPIKLFKKAAKKKKQKQLDEYVAGGLIAKTLVPEETGLLAFVCGKQSFHLPTVTVLNERGRIEKINLQDLPFLFQKKAQPFKQTLMRLVAEKKLKEAGAYLEFYRYDAKHAFANEEADSRNLPFLKYQADAAKLAWNRTMYFLKKQLES